MPTTDLPALGGRPRPAPDSPSGFGASDVAPSTARLVRRPMLTPIFFTPLPIPLAVASGSVTALATPLPTLTTDSPAALATTAASLTSFSAAIASISLMRTGTWLRPLASKVP